MKKLSHVDDQGKANMVDVSGKPHLTRTAKASGFIRLLEGTVRLIEENALKKGDVLTLAEIAGIQAAKKTSELIPLCHNLPLSKVGLTCRIANQGIEVVSEVRCVGETGVEMEALTAVSVALLTIYDMCKAVDSQMMMTDIKLDLKTKE